VATPPGSSGCPAGQYTAGTTISLTAAPAVGWAVAGWVGTDNDDAITLTNTLTMPAAARAVSVTYSIPPPTCYKLDLDHTGKGDDPKASPTTSAGCQNKRFVAGEVITLTAEPDDGWRIVGWLGTDDDSSLEPVNTVTMPAGDHAVSVIYQEDVIDCYSLALDHEGAGSDPTVSPPSSPGCPTGQYMAGATINLTAAPAEGWIVGDWFGTDNDDSTALTNIVTMPADDHSVLVFYDPVPPPCYSLALGFSGQGSAPVPSPPASTGCPDNQFVAGQLVTLIAVPAQGWHVAGWTGSDDDASQSTINTITMPTGNHTVAVIYQPFVTISQYYLPAALDVDGDPPCFAGPLEQEPNDNAATANGPLCRQTVYQGRPDDEQDYFMFDTTQPGTITVDVRGHYGAGVELMLYHQTVDGDAEAHDPTHINNSLHVALPDAPPGRYYVLIFTETPQPDEIRAYTLQVGIP
jgi:hypothetical protein